MTQPTQQLPPWLSASTFTTDGQTTDTIVFLPLTYFGPSIPLDSDWTYGGLTSPTASPSSTSSSSVSLTSSTPTSSSAASPSSPASSIVSTTATIPSSSQSATGSSSGLSSVASSASASSSASATALPVATSNDLSKGQIIGIVLGSLLGAFVLCLLFISCCFRLCRRRRDGEDETTQRSVPGQRKTSGLTALIPRRNRARTRFTMLTPGTGTGVGSTDEFDADWLMVQTPSSPPTRPTEPGTGRTEVDPFLTSMPNPHPSVGSGSGSRSGGTNGNSGSGSSRDTGATGSSGTNVSGYGVLLAHPSFSMPQEHGEGGGNPFDLPTGYGGAALPPGAAPPNTNPNGGNGNHHTYANIMPGRRILSPSQLAMLVEEEGEREVLPRRSRDLPRQSMQSSHISASGDEEGEVSYARRVTMSPSDTPSRRLSAEPAEAPAPARRSWIPRFSWLRDSRSSRDIEEDVEAGTGLLFDAGAGASSLTTSVPVSPRPRPQSKPKRPSAEMREFGARPMFGVGLGSPPSSRPVSAALAAAGSRPISGVSSDGSAKSGQTVYTDAKETLSTRGSNSRVGGGPAAVHDPMPDSAGDTTVRADTDPLDMPAPAAFAPFSSAASLHHAGSRTSLAHSASEASIAQTQPTLSHHASSASEQPQTLTGTASASTLATTTTKPERAYAYPFGPPGLGTDGDKKVGSLGSWNQAALEFGFARPASHDKLGTFGSGNRALVQVAPSPLSGPPVFTPPLPPRSPPPSAAFPIPHGSSGNGSLNAPGIRIVGARPQADRAPHLSLDLDDAPPGADGGWRALGSGVPLLGNEWGAGTGVAVGGAGKRGTFGAPSPSAAAAAQYVPGTTHSSEHGSLHSRLENSINSGSISSRSANSHAHSRNQTSSSSGQAHSQYPSSGSGSGKSARQRAALGRPVSVEGSSSPAVSAFGGKRLPEGSDSTGGGHGHEQSGSSGAGHGLVRAISPLPRARSPASPLMSPWAGGLDSDWRPTYS